MTAFKKKPKTTQCSDHCTIRLITHTHKTVASILIRIERELWIHLEKLSLDLQEGKERKLVYTGAKERLIRKLYMHQSVELKMEQGETKSVKIGRGVDKNAVCH
jgi:hypothetical protein